MQIFISCNGQKYGPFNKQDCVAALSAGLLFNDDFAWSEGLTEWIPLHSVLGMKVLKARLPSRNKVQVQVFEYSDSKRTVQVAA